MKESRVRSALEAIARRGISEDIDLWPGISARLQKDSATMRLRNKWSWSLALVLLALILLTTVAYALYRYFSDPGLQAVQDAGLFTDVNTTSEPNLLTPQPPFASGSGMAAMVDSTLTHAGVSMTLDWVYAEYAWQAVHVTASGLGPDMRVGVPELTFPGFELEGYSGATFLLEGEETLAGRYAVYQVLSRGNQPGGMVDMQVDVPIVAVAGAAAPITVFHFDVPDVEITVPWGGGGSNTYAVTVNGLEMRMQHTIFAPDYTLVRLCYQPPTAEDWIIAGARAQFGDSGPMPPGAVPMASQVELKAAGGDTCQDVTFPLAAPGKDLAFFVIADGLTVRGTSNSLDSAWQFSTYLPADLHIGGIQVAPTSVQPPLASETVGDLTATLESAYLDSNRMAFTVHFDGWQDGFSVGNLALRLADGSEVNVGGGFEPDQSDPATALITLTPATEFKSERFVGKLVVDLNTAPRGESPMTEFTFDLDLPVYRALTLQSGQTQTAHGLDLLLQQVKVTPSFTVAYVCYRKPSLGDWGVGGDVVLQIGDDRAAVSTYAMMYDTEYGDVGKGLEPGWKMPMAEGRCIKLGFPVGYHGGPETLVLQVPELEKSSPEVIPDADVKRALKILRTQGIDMDWMTFTGSGGGGGGPSFKKLPEGMTEQEAYHRFIVALGYTRPGPWNFTVELNP